MNPKIELLAPGGDINAIKAAIIAGADAIYCGLDSFNARNRAANLSFDELVGVIRLAHHYDCQIFLTLNIVILEREFKSLVRLLTRLANTTLDGVIVQDLGLLYILRKYFPTLDIHASTQLTTHNVGQVPFLKKLGVTRVNLSRELNLREITTMSKVGIHHNILSEVFVHGSLCVAFSGLCYSTSASAGNSGNRGRCSQACRDEYEPTPAGSNFPLNLKDNSAFFDLPELINAGVHSFKVEGRIKGASYVHTVIDSFRKQIDGFLNTGELLEDGERLNKVFNRDFSNAFLRGDLNQSMFINNPRDNSKYYAADKSNAISVVQIQQAEQTLNDEKMQINDNVDKQIEHLSVKKRPLTLMFSGQVDGPLIITANTEDYAKGKTTCQPQTFVVKSCINISKSNKANIDKAEIIKRFKSFNNADFDLLTLDLSQLPDTISLPFKALTALKNDLSCMLTPNTPVQAEVILPKLPSYPKHPQKNPKLSILISDETDIDLSTVTEADIYFKLPDSYKRGCTKYIDLLISNPQLIPWFPPVLIGKDFDVAIDILEQANPKLVVTNNTGVAHHAYKLGIKWIAGPFLNTTNSYALLSLKDNFDCSGAFISNEINRQQIQTIARPENFKLFYSIYHPILMMSSRQCFFQQSVGCEKPRIDNGCMLTCTKSTSITNLKGLTFAIDKQKAGYPSIFNNEPFLNTDIINDLADKFDGFMIDLTNIGSGDRVLPDKQALIKVFQQLLHSTKLKGNFKDNEGFTDDVVTKNIKDGLANSLQKLIPFSTNQQYHKGL